MSSRGGGGDVSLEMHHDQRRRTTSDPFGLNRDAFSGRSGDAGFLINFTHDQLISPGFRVYGS